MKKILGRPLLSLVCKWLDDTIPIEKIQRFLESKESEVAEDVAKVSLADVQEWAANLPGGKVVSKAGLQADTGTYLDALEREGRPEDQEFLLTSLESLLRHVEVRRKKCFPNLDPPSSPERLWLEKHDIAILFCRHACRTGDLRFLNAAFKLNDWAFKTHERRTPTKPCLARYRLALKEQERAVEELLD